MGPPVAPTGLRRDDCDHAERDAHGAAPADRNSGQQGYAGGGRQSAPRGANLPDATAQPDAQAHNDLSNVTTLPFADRREQLRIVEALLFAAAEPLDVKALAEHLRDEDDVPALLVELQGLYAGRGINLMQVAGKWQFRTAEDLAFLLERHAKEERRLSKAALETLAIIAYHQPVTRAEIEEIRGVQTSSGTLDVLMEMKWVRPRGRRRAPGRPITYGTTPEFLEHFSLDKIKDLPGLSELKGAGLLDSNLPPDFSVPEPRDVAALMPDELPLEEDEEETAELPFDDDEGEEDEDTHDGADQDPASSVDPTRHGAVDPADNGQ